MATTARQLGNVRRDAEGCERCELHLSGTQTVFGAGDEPAEVMFVGEQPGDKEDLDGRPFLGPAGAILDRGIEGSGSGERRRYVTNAVKHLRWAERGKRPIHKTPGVEHVRAWQVWLEEELRSRERDAAMAAFVADLEVAAGLLGSQ